jgi:AraC-like DNA-binding protein
MNPSLSNANGRSAGEGVSFLQLSDAWARKVPLTNCLLLSTLPRGGIQIVQPQRVSETISKPYAREFSLEDRPTWRALVDGGVVTTTDVWTDGSFETSRFYTEFLRPNGMRHVAAVALRGPVLDGYPGVLWVGRSAEQGEFSAADIRALEEAAQAIDAASEQRATTTEPAWVHVLPIKVFIYDQNAKQVFPTTPVEKLDAGLRDHMVQQARKLVGRQGGKDPIDPERTLLPDINGDLWTFRATFYPKFPALGQGPFVFLCLQPVCGDWANASAADLGADQELARLMPALKFMAKEFKNSPTLSDIAKTVHLSPFHFHRRFTELVGLTPKHYLLACQIYDAKSQLVAGTKPLPEIATDCGFAHQSHFTSRFKQTTGLTPTRWRRLALRLTGSAG